MEIITTRWKRFVVWLSHVANVVKTKTEQNSALEAAKTEYGAIVTALRTEHSNAIEELRQHCCQQFQQQWQELVELRRVSEAEIAYLRSLIGWLEVCKRDATNAVGSRPTRGGEKYEQTR